MGEATRCWKRHLRFPNMQPWRRKPHPTGWRPLAQDSASSSAARCQGVCPNKQLRSWHHINWPHVHACVVCTRSSQHEQVQALHDTKCHLLALTMDAEGQEDEWPAPLLSKMLMGRRHVDSGLQLLQPLRPRSGWPGIQTWRAV